MLEDDDLLEAIERDWRSAPLEARRLAILEFVVKLTERPGAMERSDVERLERHGLAPRDVLDVVEVAAYYAYANRVADGLGIDLED